MFLIRVGERKGCTRQLKSREMSRLIALGLMLIVFLGLILSVGGASTASASDRALNTLTGAWNITAPFFGPDSHAMVTFFKEGTSVLTGASKNNVNAHGIWKKVGRRSFVEQSREYVYENEDLALFADTTVVIELSKDGLTFVGEAVTELKLLDGTVIDEVSFTVNGSRMIFD